MIIKKISYTEFVLFLLTNKRMINTVGYGNLGWGFSGFMGFFLLGVSCVFWFSFFVESMSLSISLLLLKHHLESICSVSCSCCLCVETLAEEEWHHTDISSSFSEEHVCISQHQWLLLSQCVKSSFPWIRLKHLHVKPNSHSSHGRTENIQMAGMSKNRDYPSIPLG